MPIHTQGYRHWGGTLRPEKYKRWWIIAKAELKLLAQRKIIRLIVAVPSVIYILVHAILIYMFNYLEDAPFPFDEIGEGFFQKFIFSTHPFPSVFLLALVVVFGGSGLISNDLKYNALSLYLSKPISWVDYLIGKFIAIAVMLASMTLVPGLLLFLEQALLDDISFFIENYWLIFSIIIYSLVVTIVTSLLMLAFSSLTKNLRFATIGFCAVWFGLSIIQLILTQVLQSSIVAIVSVWANLELLGEVLFGLNRSYNLHISWTILLLTALTVFCILVLRHRIRAVEIVI